MNVLLFTISLLPLILVNSDDNFIVRTPSGALNGWEFKTRDHNIVYAFTGIPYAKPPVGDRRFQDSEPAESWTGIRNAQNYGNPCVQTTHVNAVWNTMVYGNEDCLYLSVYTPHPRPYIPFAVIVYFHGGGFAEGSGEIGKSPKYLMDSDVIVVLANYRLGIFGFLSTEDAVLGGNMGLKDQSLVLNWVQQNIGSFGGNPNEVTIMGEDGGGASVNYHMYSPLSQGLFHKAISLTGPSMAPWSIALPGAALQSAKQIAEMLNCPKENSLAILNCLKSKNSYEIAKLYLRFTQLDDTIPFGAFIPVIDPKSKNPFLPVCPSKMEAYPVPWFVGTDSLSGIYWSGKLIKNPKIFKFFADNFQKLAPTVLQYQDTATNPAQVTQQLREFYFENNTITENDIGNLTDMFSDNFFNWPMKESFKNHRGSKFVYYFDYLGQISYQEYLANRRVLKGAATTDTTFYLWKINNPLSVPEIILETDVLVSRFLITLIINFAKYGNPTPEGAVFHWPAWTDQEEGFVTFDNEGVKVKSGFLTERMRFWSLLKHQDKPINIL